MKTLEDAQSEGIIKNHIYNADSLEIMKLMQNESVDMILTDPPYGDGVGYGRRDKVILNNETEEINYKALPEFKRIIREGGVCYVFTNWKFAHKLIQFNEDNGLFKLRMMLVVVKNNIGMGHGFRNQYELCLVFEKGEVKYNSNDVSNVLKMEHIQHDSKTHPHQKGLDMLSKLIQHSSKEGDVVFDAFAGSGSVLVAAKNLGRNFIGIELDEKWAKLSSERLRQDTLL